MTRWECIIRTWIGWGKWDGMGWDLSWGKSGKELGGLDGGCRRTPMDAFVLFIPPCL